MKTIKFASDIEFIDIPKSARKYLPDWFKKSSLYAVEGNVKATSQKTFKHCMPFIDSLSSGYIQDLWCDVEVIQSNNEPVIYWKDNGLDVLLPKTIGSYGQMTPPPGYSHKMFGFSHNSYIKTPPGYSVLMTQPFNRFDTPTYVLSGIVDTDIYPLYPGSYPIFIKEGFEGIIPKGTPLIQIIPFKREAWKSEKSSDLVTHGRFTKRVSMLFLEFWYKRNAWVKKSYE
jgi:hypothetical protein